MREEFVASTIPAIMPPTKGNPTPNDNAVTSTLETKAKPSETPIAHAKPLTML